MQSSRPEMMRELLQMKRINLRDIQKEESSRYGDWPDKGQREAPEISSTEMYVTLLLSERIARKTTSVVV